MGFFDTFAGQFGFGSSGSDAASEIQKQAELSIADIKKQFGETSENIQPFIDAGIGGLGDLIQSATIPGLNERLGQIFNTDIFGQLAGERRSEVQGALSSAGLTRSGAAVEELGRIPSEIALFIENMLAGRTQNLVGGGQTSAFNLGNFGQNAQGQIAALRTGIGEGNAAGIVTDASQNALGLNNIGDILSSLAPLFASGSTGVPGLDPLGGGGGGISTALSIGSLFFSDPRLKKNVRVVGKIGKLDLYEWEWIAEAKGTIIELSGKMGFMADQVKRLFPHHVHEFGGYDLIDYGRVLTELEAK